LLVAPCILLESQEVVGQGYELDSLSAEPPPVALSGDAYSMQADLASTDDFKAAGDGFAVTAQSTDLLVIDSVTFPPLTISWNAVSGLRVAWFDPTERFTLEAATTLGTAAAWSAVDEITHEGATAVFESGRSELERVRFFRLRGR
jgi:hypothetical protein